MQPSSKGSNVLWEGRLDHMSQAFASISVLQTTYHKVRIYTFHGCRKVKPGRFWPYPFETGTLADYEWPAETPSDAIVLTEELYCRGRPCTSTGPKKYPNCAFRIHIEHSASKSRIISFNSHGEERDNQDSALSKKRWGLSEKVLLFIPV